MVVILRTMTALSAFAAIFAATGGGPGSATEILNLYAYRTSFTELNLGYGASLAVVLLSITLAISWLDVQAAAEAGMTMTVLRRAATALKGRRGKGASGQATACDLRRSAHARRLPCDARARGLPQNSLRSLRSLRSNSRGKSDDEARCARGHKPCASRRLTRMPWPARTRLCRTAVLARRVHDRSGRSTVQLRGRRSSAGAISAATSSAGLGSARAQHALRHLTIAAV